MLTSKNYDVIVKALDCPDWYSRELIIARFCDVLLEDNPLFNKEQFKAACKK